MQRRKIQLVAGTTYTVSLPKEWVKKNGLKEKDEVLIQERNNQTLTISSSVLKDSQLKEISLNIDEHSDNIDQVLFSIYYLGIENITLFSKKELSKETRSQIRKTLTYMSGTEIGYEDTSRITIRVLLDKSKISINQILYRINLILDLSLSNLTDNFDIEEIRMNENEIDRLYHLCTKIVSLSLRDSNVLNSSEIRNVSLIPSYFLISKRLENIADNINHLSEYIEKNKARFDDKKIAEFIRKELSRSILNLIKKSATSFKKIKKEEVMKISEELLKTKDKTVFNYLDNVVRFIVDVEEEIVNISFYKQLIEEELL
ncbi:phosphate uptake regulator PhoU [Candidatus Woesearchaeota archaeon]|nr:phosphate uptake regulator PhoU [Candidatus Woesearchaeota archaeon]